MPSSSGFRAFAGAFLPLLVLLLAAPLASALEPGEFDPGLWDALLKKYVAEGRVDYAAWKNGNIAELDALLDSMAVYDPTSVMGKEPRAAFYMNAYHAWAVRQILEHYPVASVTEIPGFFDKNPRRIAGEDRTLDQIEAVLAAMLPHRPDFALSLCKGMAGGPPLREDAFQSGNLLKLFDRGVKEAFDRNRIRYDPAANAMHYPPEVSAYLPAYEALPQGILDRFGPYLSLGTVVALNTKHPSVVVDLLEPSLNGIPPRAVLKPGSGAP